MLQLFLCCFVGWCMVGAEIPLHAQMPVVVSWCLAVRMQGTLTQVRAAQQVRHSFAKDTVAHKVDPSLSHINRSFVDCKMDGNVSFGVKRAILQLYIGGRKTLHKWKVRWVVHVKFVPGWRTCSVPECSANDQSTADILVATLPKTHGHKIGKRRVGAGATQNSIWGKPREWIRAKYANGSHNFGLWLEPTKPENVGNVKIGSSQRVMQARLTFHFLKLQVWVKNRQQNTTAEKPKKQQNKRS